jgi:hypothetical protein
MENFSLRRVGGMLTLNVGETFIAKMLEGGVVRPLKGMQTIEVK